MEKTGVISGITGQDGALLASYLLDKNYKVVGIVRSTSSSTDWRLHELGIINHPNLVLCSGDLIDQGSIERIIDKHQPDEFYNLGAQSFVGSSWELPINTIDITGLGAIRVFDAVRNVKPDTRVYQASSSEMFGGRGDQLLSEESPFDPQSPYAVAKAAAHYAAKVYRDSFGMFVSCGILFNHEGPYRGEQFVTRKVTKAVAEIDAGLRESFSLHNFDSVRDWGDAEEYVEAMYLMLQHNEPDDFVIATGVSYSIYDLCDEAFDYIGISDFAKWEKFVKLEGSRPSDVKRLRGDASKAHRVLGWTPKISFRRMVQKMVIRDRERLLNV